jgi:hypothetical protein
MDAVAGAGAKAVPWVAIYRNQGPQLNSPVQIRAKSWQLPQPDWRLFRRL